MKNVLNRADQYQEPQSVLSNFHPFPHLSQFKHPLPLSIRQGPEQVRVSSYGARYNVSKPRLTLL